MLIVLAPTLADYQDAANHAHAEGVTPCSPPFLGYQAEAEGKTQRIEEAIANGAISGAIAVLPQQWADGMRTPADPWGAPWADEPSARAYTTLALRMFIACQRAGSFAVIAGPDHQHGRAHPFDTAAAKWAMTKDGCRSTAATSGARRCMLAHVPDADTAT